MNNNANSHLKNYQSCHIVANKNLSLIASSIGTGYLSYKDTLLTAKNTDHLLNPNGIFLNIQTESHSAFLTHAPEYNDPNSQKHLFSQTKNSLQYSLSSKAFSSTADISILEDIDLIKYQFTVENKLHKQNFISTFYLEPSLSKYDDLVAHRTYTKLFIETQYDENTNSVIYSKKLSDKDNSSLYFAVFSDDTSPLSFDTDRKSVLSSPFGISSLSSQNSLNKQNISGVSESCLSLSFSDTIDKNSRATHTVFLTVATSKEGVLENIKAAKSIKQYKQSNINTNPLISKILSYTEKTQNLQPQVLTALKNNTTTISELYSLSISNDYPIVLYPMSQENSPSSLNQLLDAFLYLKNSHINIDLAIACDDSCKDIVKLELEKRHLLGLLDQRSGIFIIPSDKKQLVLPFASYLFIENDQPQTPTDYQKIKVLPCLPRSGDFKLDDNTKTLPVGTFTNNGYLTNSNTTLPHATILANRSFGTLLSNKSLGFSYALNSREIKLTPLSNDPLIDNYGEQILIKIGNKFFSPINGATVFYNYDSVVYFGVCDKIQTKVTVTIPDKGMAKHIDIEFLSDSDTDIEVAFYTEIILFVDQKNKAFIKTTPKKGGSLSQNTLNKHFSPFACVNCSEQTVLTVTDKKTFFKGNFSSDNSTNSNNDCVANIIKKHLPAKRKERISFVLSFGLSEKSAKATHSLSSNPQSDDRFELSTGDVAFDTLFNTFLPKQIIEARVFSRTGFYQCGGAYGFRDQLQDVSSIIHLHPDIAKTHILRCCASQFIEGDALHWWHNLPKGLGGKKGVRTKYSDDFLFLPYTLCEYVEKTADKSILDIQVPYIDGKTLDENQTECYDHFLPSKTKESVFIHAKRAVDHALRFGKHGLSLIMGGDWNDGFNNIGINGKGESVWLSMFLICVLERFLKLCKSYNFSDTKIYSDTITQLKTNIDQYAYDGDWYKRAFFDDGTVIGSKQSCECSIDLLPQAFAVFSNLPDTTRVKSSLNSAYNLLVDHQHMLIKLLDPPFSSSKLNPGYIKKYPKGIRENGGQYTHASVWFAMALFKFGETKKATTLLQYLLPYNRYLNQTTTNSYMLEPYFLAGDIYSHPNAYAQGGWSIYTGSAAWLYKLITEDFLGILVLGDRLKINPKCQLIFSSFSLKARLNNTNIHIHASIGNEKGSFIDGVKCSSIPLDGKDKTISVFF